MSSFNPQFNPQFGNGSIPDGPNSSPPYSGTYDFSLSNADIIIEAFERIQIGPSAFEPRHIISARRSLNIELQEWANRGVNLWVVDQYSVPLTQGISLYTLAPEIVNPLDVYIRTFQLGALNSVAQSFTTTLGSNQVTINVGGAQVGGYVQIAIPVAIGGIILFGYYPVISVPNANTATIQATGQYANNSVTGGTVPAFTTTLGSASVNVNIPGHGLLVGQPFNVEVPTTVGGVTLNGSYAVATVVDFNNFTIIAPANALSGATVSENGGRTQIAVQVQNAAPVDIMLYPLSRDDYAMIPDKFVQGRPTTFWFNRLINPTMTVWQVPDATQPYELMFFAMRRIQDADPISGQAPEIPMRFLEALISKLTARLAEKFKPEMHAAKIALGNAAWDLASAEDREKAPTYIAPDLSGYFDD